ncbi:hypothetical protein AB0F71_12565 [Kitasatospora sp. NPDC028055]|uniref:hypothetical protein n=1 Tax=Kitasatospora sp. NPDC028055 TaxID=3155653 RepID=UPI003410FD90
MTRTVPRRSDIRVRTHLPGLAIVHEPVAADHGSVFATAAPSAAAEVGFRLLPPPAPEPAG